MLTILYLEGFHTLFGENYTLFGNLAMTTINQIAGQNFYSDWMAKHQNSDIKVILALST